MQLLAAIAVIAISFAITWVVTHVQEKRRIAAVESQFYANRAALGDEAFLAALPECTTPAFHLAARRAMAKLCGTTADMIHPHDKMRELLNLQFDCGFIQDFIFYIEDEANVRLDMNNTPNPETARFGEYVQQLARVNKIEKEANG